MNMQNLNDEQPKKLAESQTVEEATKLAEGFGVELSDEVLESVAGGREKRKLVSCTVYTVCWYDKDIEGVPYYTEDVFWTEEKAKAFMAEHGGTIEPRHRFRLE